jgi:hypothetical protein
MSNQLPDTPWNAPANPASPASPGDVSGVDAAVVNGLADKLDARATALKGVGASGTEIATQGKTAIETAAQGYPIGSQITAALAKCGTALDAAIGRISAQASGDATTLRGVVSGRKTIEKDTKKALENTTAPSGTTYV